MKKIILSFVVICMSVLFTSTQSSAAMITYTLQGISNFYLFNVLAICIILGYFIFFIKNFLKLKENQEKEVKNKIINKLAVSYAIIALSFVIILFVADVIKEKSIITYNFNDVKYKDLIYSLSNFIPDLAFIMTNIINMLVGFMGIAYIIFFVKSKSIKKVIIWLLILIPLATILLQIDYTVYHGYSYYGVMNILEDNLYNKDFWVMLSYITFSMTVIISIIGLLVIRKREQVILGKGCIILILLITLLIASINRVYYINNSEFYNKYKNSTDITITQDLGFL